MSSSPKQQDRFFQGSVGRQWMRMAINLFTGLGAGVSTYSIFVAFQGQIREAWLWLMIAVLIDAADGTLIRTLQLKTICPNFDGERLDEYADLLTFVIGPLAIIVANGQLPMNIVGAFTAMAVVGGSCLQFSYQDAKTSEAFWGFPAYWNIIYFYGWAFETSPEIIISLSLVLTVFLFLPIPFVYPSRTPIIRSITIALGIAWSLLLFYILWVPTLSTQWVYISLFYPAYYVLLSLILYPQLKRSQ